MTDKYDWSSDEQCTFCNGTGTLSGINEYCHICNGDKFLRKPNPADKWFLIHNREQIIEKWMEYVQKRCCYDTFVQPKEYPCLARFFTDQCADSYGNFVQYFYRENLPDSWAFQNDEVLAGVGL